MCNSQTMSDRRKTKKVCVRQETLDVVGTLNPTVHINRYKISILVSEPFCFPE